MLSRWVPPITCSRPVFPGRLTRTQNWVVAPVQCAHRRFQCLPVPGGGQGIAVGAQLDPLAAAAAHPKPAVAVPADGAHPDRAVVAIRAAHHIRLEPRQFLGMQPRIHKP
jgi:hypothetical protein